MRVGYQGHLVKSAGGPPGGWPGVSGGARPSCSSAIRETSCYHHRWNREPKYAGGLPRFIREEQWGIRRQIDWLNTLLRNQSCFDSCLIVRYEDLQRDTKRELGKTLSIHRNREAVRRGAGHDRRGGQFPEHETG